MKRRRLESHRKNANRADHSPLDSMRAQKRMPAFRPVSSFYLNGIGEDHPANLPLPPDTEENYRFERSIHTFLKSKERVV